jgi:hypothetical protein
MKNVPENYLSKIKTMKNVILTTSGLLSEYGNSISLELGDIDYNQNVNDVYEIVLELKLTDVYCPECDHEPNMVSNTINEIIKKIYKGCNFGLTGDLQFKNSFMSTRGVLLYETKLWRDNFEYIVFGIFIDPGQKY